MQPVQGEPQCCGDAEHSSVVSPPRRTLPSELTPSPTWAASSPADLCFLAEGPWQAASLPSDRSFPRYYYENGSGPVSEQTLKPESMSEPSKPRRVEFLSVVLGIAFARLLLGIRLPILHNSLSPYDVTPDVTDDAFERRLEIAPNTVGQRFIPRRVVHPDVDEKGNRRTTTSARTRVRVAGRATKGATALLLLMRVMTSPVTTPPVTAATTGAHEKEDVRLRRVVTLESCIGHVYTHSGHPKHEFHCSAYWKACVLAATDPVHVCNRGFKWFSSIKSCLASCVNGRHVSDRCYARRAGRAVVLSWQEVRPVELPAGYVLVRGPSWRVPQLGRMPPALRAPHRVGVRRDASCRDGLTSPAEAPLFRRHAATRWSSLCQRDPACIEVAPHLDRV
ncbi:uncharacterized protein LOC142777323 [Rhipicephalus microplus]|uniref:uncharacterized protein LOC142777323 n=1 Tax=Rhipicephalus microplus TaxID=6941 RepID=UPI003F6A65AE